MIRESHRDASLVDVQSRKHIIVPRDKCLASHRSASLIQWLKFQPLYRLLGTRGEPRHPSYKSYVQLRARYAVVRPCAPLQYKGVDAYRKSWEEWLPTFRGPVGYEIRDLSITAGDDVAFCHSLNRISGTRANGEKTDTWVRATVCYHKIDGTWMVTHEHFSVPFYMDGSFKAAVDLKP